MIRTLEQCYLTKTIEHSMNEIDFKNDGMLNRLHYMMIFESDIN